MNRIVKLGEIWLSLVVLTIFFTQQGYGQGNEGPLGKNYVPTVISPEAASLGKFLNFPVVENSGLTAVNVPLASVGFRNFHIPLQLNYHPSGIKVNQEATWVGLGWSFSAEGAITREVRGLPDDEYFWKSDPYTGQESDYFGWLKSYVVPYNAEQIRTFPYMPWDGLNPETSAEPVASITFIRLFDKTNVNYTSDTEPDMFFVNAPGISFKFLFDDQGVPRVLGLGNYKIDYFYDECPDCVNNLNPIEKFTVTTDEGVSYFFEEYEVSEGTTTKKVRSLSSATEITLTDSYKYRSSWLLTKVSTPEGFYANYVYYPVKDILTKQALVYSSNGCTELNSDLCSQNMENMYGTTESTLGKKYLKSITTHEQKVEFYLDSDPRLDLPGGAVLDRFTISSRENGNVVKEVALNYNYVNSTTAECSTAEDPSYCKRLFLNAVNINGEHNYAKGENYSFDYYNTYPLPPKQTFEQDFWGYYNNNNATTIIPRIYIYPEKSGADRYRIYPLHTSKFTTQYVTNGANRNVNATYVKSGSLAKVTFPTGGSASYEYEPNDYYDEGAQTNNKGGGIRIKNIKFYDPVTRKETIKNYKYSKNQGGIEVSSGKLIYAPAFAHEIGYAFDPNFLENGDFYFMTRSGEIFLQNMKGYSCDPKTGGYSDGKIEECKITHLFTAEEKWTTFTETLSFSFTPLSETEGNTVQYERLEIFDGGTGKEVHNYYPPKSYISNATQVKSTYAAPFGYDSTPSLCELHEYSNCASPGAYVGYGNIQFTGSNIYPFPRLSDNGIYTNGKISSIEYWNQDGVLVKDKEYQYEAKFKNGEGPEIINGLSHTIMPIEYVRNSRLTFPKMYAHYRIDAEADAVVKQIKTRELYSDANIETDEYYYYNDNLLLQKYSRVLSNGEINETRYRYPLDYNLSGITTNYYGEQLKGMIERNILNKAIEVWEVKNNKVINATYYSQKIMQASLLVLESFYELESEVPVSTSEFAGNSFSGNTFYLNNYYKRRARYYYDNQGLVIRTIMPDGINRGYLFGYSKEGPIAIVANAFSSRVAFTSFEGDGSKGRWEFNYANVTSSTSRAGKKSFKSGQIKISSFITGKYEVSFWAKSSNGVGTVTISDLPDAVEVSGADWQYFTIPLKDGVNSVTIDLSSSIFIDDLRLYPEGAQIISYTYEPLIGVSSMSDNNGNTTFYEYDWYGRLQTVKDKDGNIVEHYQYNLRE